MNHSPLRGVARLHVDEIRFDWFQPYNKHGSGDSVGSASVIKLDTDSVYLLTAFHVIQHAENVWCSFSALGRQRFAAVLLGACPDVDAALLKVSRTVLPETHGEKLQPLQLGNSDVVRVNDDVRALGFPQGEHSAWSTKGVIAGRLADTGQFQIDASINHGNSGGGLVNADGALIGVVVARHSRGTGMGYATPIAQIVPRLKEMSRIDTTLHNSVIDTPSLNASLGIGSRALMASLGAPNDKRGAYVRYVLSGTPLHNAGVRSGDVLLAVGVPLDDYAQVSVPFWDERLHINALLRRASLNVLLEVAWWSAEDRTEHRRAVRFDQSDRFMFRTRHPPRDFIDYETFGGLVVMRLMPEHLQNSKEFSMCHSSVLRVPDLRANPPLVVTHVMSGSSLSGLPLIEPPDSIDKVNGKQVRSLQEYRDALLTQPRARFVRFETKDGQATVLECAKALSETEAFSRKFGFDLSATTRTLIRQHRE